VSKSARPGWHRSYPCWNGADSTSSRPAGGNFAVAAYPGLIVKDSYWRWPERELAGNAIDCCTQILGLSFHDAMRALIQI